MTTVLETRNFKEVKVSTVVLPDGRIETIIFYNGSEAKEMSKLSTIDKQHSAAISFVKKSNLSVIDGRVYISI